MMLPQKFKNWMLALTAMALTQVALAGPKTLIELSGDSPTPALAKAWNKVSEGQYEFTLDTSKEVAKGQPVSAAAVKDALESKLGADFGVKVADKGNGVVGVAYTGDEKKFLAGVANTKIRGKDVELALESSVSEGGIRANPGDRHPGAGEVKATVIKLKPDLITAKVSETNAKGVANGTTVKIKGNSKNFSVTQKIFFVPEKQDGGVWVPKAGSLTDK